MQVFIPEQTLRKQHIAGTLIQGNKYDFYRFFHIFLPVISLSFRPFPKRFRLLPTPLDYRFL